MEHTDFLKSLFIDTAKRLKGNARRRIMAYIVKELGTSGANRAKRELRCHHKTLRKGIHEVENGLRASRAVNSKADLRGKITELVITNYKELS